MTKASKKAENAALSSRGTLDLTQGSIVKGLLAFSLPLMAGNLLQQCYNIADTLIVGRFLGDTALAAVGSAYTLMILLTSIVLGLSMGAGAFLSIMFGAKDRRAFDQGFFMSLTSIGLFTLIMNLAVVLGIDGLLHFMQVNEEVYRPMRRYTLIVFAGIMATFLYNYFASVLRAIGNSLLPLILLAVSSLLNIVLDLLFVAVYQWGIEGAAWATVISQYVSGLGLTVYSYRKLPYLRLSRKDMVFEKTALRRIARLALLTSLQQSIMNFGILLVQGRVNSFGTQVMAAFAASVKIDTLAYSPVQDFGNAYSTFVAQNHGAQKDDRIRLGTRKSALAVLVFCLIISTIVFLFGRIFLSCFTKDPAVITIGVRYLRIEGSFYALIGFLFMFYGYFRALERPGISIVLTVISLGTRVLLAYALSAVPSIGVTGIWISIPIGWALADLAGLVFYNSLMKTISKGCQGKISEPHS
ncbi:MAG TPA: MATE family efflux transporter [Lachnospiraceae bacterium]|nr:MATE family efflux transporter [Lachnospiraceae bacterium]